MGRECLTDRQDRTGVECSRRSKLRNGPDYRVADGATGSIDVEQQPYFRLRCGNPEIPAHMHELSSFGDIVHSE